MGRYMVVAITGANGFVGGHITQFLQEKQVAIRPITRQQTGDYAGTIRTDWLDGIKTIIHCAAIAHQTGKLSAKQETLIFKVNSDLPVYLAQQAAGHGVQQFIFLSTAHVYGRSAMGLIDENSDVLPTSAYAAAKMDAENRLVDVCEKLGIELVILRPPLIYGPGVKANFYRLMQLVDSGLPLPFGSLNEPRSYLYIGNLCHAISRLLRDSAGWNDVYNIADDTPLSIKELTNQLAAGLGHRAMQMPAPKTMLTAGLTILGRRHMIETLCKPLLLDTRSIKAELNWLPPIDTADGLRLTAKWYKDNKK